MTELEKLKAKRDAAHTAVRDAYNAALAALAAQEKEPTDD